MSSSSSASSSERTSRRKVDDGPSSSPQQRPQTKRQYSSSASSSWNRTNNNNSNRKKWIQDEIRRLGRQGRIEEALDLYYSLEKERITPTLRQTNAIVDACARATPVRYETALQIVHERRQRLQSNNNRNQHWDEDVVNVYTYGALMGACARQGDVKNAARLLQQMVHDDGIAPNAVVYQAAMTACARSTPHPNLAQALSWLQQAQNEGVPLTIVGYNTVCAAAARMGDYETVLRLLRDCQNNSNSTKPTPDAITYGTLLSACARAREWNLLLQYAEEMRQAGFVWDGLACTSVLHACQELGMASTAVDVLNQMKEQQQQEEEHDNSNQASLSSYPRMTAGLEIAGMRPPLTGPDEVAVRMAMTACARAGDWYQAIQLLLQHEEYCNGRPPDTAAYTTAIAGCDAAGEYKYALALLDRMRKIDNLQPDEKTITAVLGACATACANQQQSQSSSDDTSDTTNIPDPMRKALLLLHVLENEPTTPVQPTIAIYNAVLCVCAEARQVQRAFDLYDKIVSLQDTDDKSPDVQPNIITYGTLMMACERVGDLRSMERVFAEMKRHYNSRDSDEDIRPNEVVYGAAISCCRKANNKYQESTLDTQSTALRAYRLWELMIQQGLSTNAVTCNTVIAAQTEECQRILARTNKSNNNNSKKETSSSSSNNIMNNKKKRTRTAVDLTNPLNDALDRAMAVYNTMTGVSSAGNEEEEEENDDENGTDKSLSLSSTCCGRPNRSTYNLLIRALATHGRPDQALHLLRTMRSNGYVPDVDLYTLTVTAYERKGQPIAALRLLDDMRQDGYDFYGLPVLNEVFKKAIKLANTAALVVGRGGQGVRKVPEPNINLEQQEE